MDTGEKKELVPEKEIESPIDNLKIPSPGEDLLERIRKKEILEDKKETEYASKIINGVEVVDVKAVPSKEKLSVDKFGIPESKERRTWDRI